MSYNDDQPRDDHGRFASGNSGQRLSRAAQERVALNKQTDASLYHNTGSAAPKGYMARMMAAVKANYGAHSMGVHSIPRRMS